MQRIGLCVDFVAQCLTRLRQQYQRCCIGRLKAEGKIEQDKGIKVVPCQTRYIYTDLYYDDDGLPKQKERRAKESGECFCLACKPVGAERCCKVGVWPMEPPVVGSDLQRS